MRSALAAGLLLALALPAISADDTAWPAATREARPWTRWWWLGSAVDQPNLARELKEIAGAGFGGVEITPIYGAKGAEKRFLPFLSPEYVAALRFTTEEAGRLGMAVDMATGTGWPFGGPQVSEADAELEVAFGPDGALAPRPTRFKVKRSAPGGEGWVINPYSTAALGRYLKPFTEALSALPRGAIHGQFHDSFEYKASWAGEVPARFRAMHGYELASQAQAFAGKGDPDTVARVRSDYRETLGALHMDYVRDWISWTHAQGSVARNQAHGAPSNLLDLYAMSDIPETEIFGCSELPIPGYRRDVARVSPNHIQPLVNRFASSAAHVAGRPLASSETFTWNREHFCEAPREMKPELDQLLLTGINHVFYHGTAYSPEDAGWPGWLFYASTQFNPRNSLWRDFASLNAYVTRAQSLLQSGRPDNDLLVYWPMHDQLHNDRGYLRQFSVHGKEWLTEASTGALAKGLLAAGASFDFISDAQLGRSSVVKGREIRTEGGLCYKAVVVPGCSLMPEGTLRQLIDLAEAGATVIFAEGLPTDVPGLGRLEERRADFKGQLARVAHPGKGRVIVGGGIDAALAASGARLEVIAQGGLGLLRRATDEGHLYFIANLGAKAVDVHAPLATPAKGAVLLDARSGRSGVASLEQVRAGARIRLQLEPGESVFVKTFTERVASGAAWAYRGKAGEPVAIKGEWRVSFLRGGPVLPAAYATRELASWTARGGDYESFAGTARYETEFELPAGAKADDWVLDVGEVCETARVFVNGREVDHLWCLPFRTSIGAALKPGRNRLAIEVSNLSANRIRDLDRRGVTWKNFHEINFVNVFYRPFDASGWALQESGLMGPVRILPQVLK